MHASDCRNKPGILFDSILALGVRAAVDWAGAEGGVCVLDRLAVFHSVGLDTRLSRISILVPHTVEQGQTDGKGQRSNQILCKLMDGPSTYSPHLFLFLL